LAKIKSSALRELLSLEQDRAVQFFDAQSMPGLDQQQGLPRERVARVQADRSLEQCERPRAIATGRCNRPALEGAYASPGLRASASENSWSAFARSLRRSAMLPATSSGSSLSGFNRAASASRA